VVRLLHLNVAQSALKQTSEDDLYKVLVLDSFTKSVIAPLLRVNELRKHGITMHLMLETEREKIPDTPAIYFVRAGEEAVQRIVADAAAGLYDSLHLNFTPHLQKPLLEQLAAGKSIQQLVVLSFPSAHDCHNLAGTCMHHVPSLVISAYLRRQGLAWPVWTTRRVMHWLR
jgi:hypothetical protein